MRVSANVVARSSWPAANCVSKLAMTSSIRVFSALTSEPDQVWRARSSRAPSWPRNTAGEAVTARSTSWPRDAGQAGAIFGGHAGARAAACAGTRSPSSSAPPSTGSDTSYATRARRPGRRPASWSSAMPPIRPLRAFRRRRPDGAFSRIESAKKAGQQAQVRQRAKSRVRRRRRLIGPAARGRALAIGRTCREGRRGGRRRRPRPELPRGRS